MLPQPPRDERGNLGIIFYQKKPHYRRISNMNGQFRTTKNKKNRWSLSQSSLGMMISVFFSSCCRQPWTHGWRPLLGTKVYGPTWEQKVLRRLQRQGDGK